MLDTKLNRANVEILVKSIAADKEVADSIVVKILEDEDVSFKEFGTSGETLDEFLNVGLIDKNTLASLIAFDDDYHTLFEI